MVLGLERNGTGPFDLYREERHPDTGTEEPFPLGLTGPACHLHYDRGTGRLTQIDDPDIDQELEVTTEEEHDETNIS